MKKSRVFRFFLPLLLLIAACGGREEAAPAPAEIATPPAGLARQTILVLGNSIAAGLGVEPEESFPGRLQQFIDSTGLAFEVVNAGVSGETTAGGLGRIDWLLRQRVDVLIIELGGNDGLRGTVPEATKANLVAIIERTRDRYPEADILLAGMQMPPNLGQLYTERFREIFPEIAAEHDTHLVPFLLDRVGGVASLNQPDGIHPTPEGHHIVAETVWRYLEPVLRARML
ncbi:MAG: arylesterase [Rhodothermales bacterium]|nr:arylesterase [Rhodothermales bacterium]